MIYMTYFEIKYFGQKEPKIIVVFYEELQEKQIKIIVNNGKNNLDKWL